MNQILVELNRLYAAHINHHVHMGQAWSDQGRQAHEERALVLRQAIEVAMTGFSPDMGLFEFIDLVERSQMARLFGQHVSQQIAAGLISTR